MKFADALLLADLGAEKVLAAEKGARRIVVDIKGFSNPSLFSELQKAAGQYQMYRVFLSHLPPPREVFLAIPHAVYEKSFQRPSVRVFVASQNFKLLTFDPVKEEIVQWID